MTRARLAFQPHEGGAMLDIDVSDLSALERVQLVLMSVRAAINGRMHVHIAHAQTFRRGRAEDSSAGDAQSALGK